jgi:thiamine biosynthesis lipoprotein
MKWLKFFVLALVLVAGSSGKCPPVVPPPGSAVPSPGSGRMFVSHFENVLGTSMELKVLARSEEEASVAESAAIKEIGRLQRILSAYDDQSEFSQWLRTTNEAVQVSPELFEVLNLFDKWRITTGGALDASAEVITKLWKHTAALQRVPTAQELAAAVSEVRQPHWKLDPAGRTATHLSQAPLMLNSFAKSYIIKHAADAAMGSVNVKAIVVNIGGDLVIAGDLKENVLISDPKADAENDPPMDQLLLANRAVATSGNYRRGELIDGHWYSHIVDPRTGQPADGVISATVVAPGATDAGALATTFNVLSPAESIRLAAGLPGVEYLIITSSGQRLASAGWHLLEKPVAAKPGDNGDATRKKADNTGLASDFELVVNLEINLQKEGFAKRPYVAVWVEDENHAPVRTIAIWHERDRYLPELKSWYLKYREIYNTDKNVLGTVSSATRSAGKYSMKWDGKDDKGNLVKPGKYTIKIEATREHGTYQLMRQELDLNETPQLINLPGNVEISSVSLDYRKKAAGN